MYVHVHDGGSYTNFICGTVCYKPIPFGLIVGILSRKPLTKSETHYRPDVLYIQSYYNCGLLASVT
jgi:hypothetical protein